MNEIRSEGPKMEMVNKETWKSLNEAGTPEMIVTRPGRLIFIKTLLMIKTFLSLLMVFKNLSDFKSLNRNDSS